MVPFRVCYHLMFVPQSAHHLLPIMPVVSCLWELCFQDGFDMCDPMTGLLAAVPVACNVPQIDAGAEVILTQPPLDWEAFESWMSDARNRGLHTAARLLIGFPCLSSAGNVAFWAALCQAGSNPKVQRTGRLKLYDVANLCTSSLLTCWRAGCSE